MCSNERIDYCTDSGVVFSRSSIGRLNLLQSSLRHHMIATAFRDAGIDESTPVMCPRSARLVSQAVDFGTIHRARQSQCLPDETSRPAIQRLALLLKSAANLAISWDVSKPIHPAEGAMLSSAVRAPFSARIGLGPSSGRECARRNEQGYSSRSARTPSGPHVTAAIVSTLAPIFSIMRGSICRVQHRMAV